MMKVESKTETVVKNTYTLTLTEQEAVNIKSLFGKMRGNSRFPCYVFLALNNALMNSKLKPTCKFIDDAPYPNYVDDC
jgi:hypothetical protein